MRIEVGKYVLYSDKWSMWICEKYEVRKKKTKEPTGKIDERRITGYVTSLPRLLENFRTKKIGDSDAESIEELLEVLNDTYADMVALNKGAVEADFKRIEKLK